MRQFLTRYFKGDKVLWAVIVGLFLFSLLAVYSSTGTLAYKYKAGNTTYYLLRHMKFLILGVFVVYVTHRIHYRVFSKLALVFYYAAIPLLLITLFFGVTRNEASRWLTLPGIGIDFQTSDLAKIALLMYIARILSQNQDSQLSLDAAYKPIITATAIICGLILPANFSTAFLLFTTAWLLMFIGRISIKKLLKLVAILIGAVSFILMLAMLAPDKGRLSTWKNRIENFINGSEGKNYQVDQSKIAIVSGGMTGCGPGQSMQRNFLPHPYSDFIFAIIVEEYGSIGGLFVVFLYLYLLFRTGIIVKKSSRAFPAFLAIGLTISLVLQAMVNMAVAVNLIPVTGQPLPFISMGGTSIVFTSLALGMVISISRTLEKGELDEEKQEPIAVETTQETTVV